MPASRSIEDRVVDLCNRGNAEVGKDAFDKARKLYEEALQLGEKSMDPEMRIGVREALAQCYSRLKEFKKAVDCNREALRLLETEWSDTYGSRHVLTRQARRDLAINLSKLFSSQDDASPSVLKEAVDLRLKNIEILRTLKRPKALADAQHKVLADIVKLVSSRPSDIDTSILLLQAAPLYEELFSAWRKADEPPDSLRFIEARHNYGVTLHELSKFEEAKKVFLENQAILDGSSEADKKRFEVVAQNADRYLASCIEKTNDLSLGINRRCTGSLEDKIQAQDSKPEEETKQEELPALVVDKPKKSSRPSDTSTESSHHRKNSPSVPGAFPDVDTSRPTTNGKLSPSPIDDAEPKRSRSKSGRNRIGEDGKLLPSPIHGGESKRSRSNSGAKLFGEEGRPWGERPREEEYIRKSRRPSDTGAPAPDPDQKSDISSAIDGELFTVPDSANDADVWMIRMRKYAHTLLKYREPFSSKRKRIRVAIIDSGVQRGVDRSSTRSDIWKRKNRIKEYKDFTGENQDWTDSSKLLHGTNCASLCLQVAPETDLYIANVVSPTKDGMEAKHVAQAMKWAINDKNVDIISMSLGWDEWKHQVAAQISEARQKHVLIFAAASNDGLLKPTYGVYPAWDPTVFCINVSSGSGTKWERNPIHSDDKVNLMFVGKDVAVLGTNNKPELPNDERLTGTSFATPIAAATAALVLDLVRWQVSNYPKVERCLKTYEGMSAVFQAMSGKPSKDNYYHVMPWNMLGKDKKPISLVGANESDEWYSLNEVCSCLRRFGDVGEQLD